MPEGWAGPRGTHITGSYYYAPEGDVRVEPGDLEHFARLLDGDADAFHNARLNAVDEFFTEPPFPPFAGRTADFPGGMAEGAAFERYYFNVEIALRMLLNDVEQGLRTLQLASTLIHQAYLMSDWFGTGDPGGGGFAMYEDDAVAAVFTPATDDGLASLSEDEEEELDEMMDDASDQFREEVERYEDQGEALDDLDYSESSFSDGGMFVNDTVVNESGDAEFVVDDERAEEHANLLLSQNYGYGVQHGADDGDPAVLDQVRR